MNQKKLIVGWRNISSTTGLSRYKLIELIARGQFPSPRRLGYRTIVWTSSEIASWAASLQGGELDE